MNISAQPFHYKQYGDCVRISNGEIQLVVIVGSGPRIIRFSFEDGDNVFAELDQEGFETENGYWRILGGHRLWHSPEASPRTYTPDVQPVFWECIDGGIRVIQKPHEHDCLEKQMDITIDDEHGATIVHRISNKSMWPIEFSVWALSAMATAGTLIVPQNTDETGLLPNRNVVFWPYTNVKDARADLGNKYALVHQGAGSTSFMFGQKIHSGWAAYAVHGDLFLKKFGFVPGAIYPDYGCSFESYCCDFMIEVESLSPVLKIEPGAYSEHTEHWKLFKGISQPSSEEEADDIAKKLGLQNGK